MYELHEIKENYQRMSDAKIEKIAREESKTLREDVLVILKEEIESRKLDKRLITWITAETNTLTDIEKQALIRKIQQLQCPNCKLENKRLVGQEFTTIVSVIVWCQKTTKNNIACSDCVRRKKINSFFINGLVGWWSRSGIILTPTTLIKDTVNLFYRNKINNRVMDDFIEKNSGMFRLKGTNDETILNLLVEYNRLNESPKMSEANIYYGQ